MRVRSESSTFPEARTSLWLHPQELPHASAPQTLPVLDSNYCLHSLCVMSHQI